LDLGSRPVPGGGGLDLGSRPVPGGGGGGGGVAGFLCSYAGSLDPMTGHCRIMTNLFNCNLFKVLRLIAYRLS
jgi:hypothetical protein